MCLMRSQLKKIKRQRMCEKKYDCPIKPGLECSEYNKRMNEYRQWLKRLSTQNNSVIFYQGSDADYCPRKSCPIYSEWKNQQKTR